MVDIWADEQLLIKQVDIANTFMKRLQGMIARPIPALLIPKCRSIHTFFMNKPIDVIFLDSDYRILDIAKHVLPRQICGHKSATHVLEIESNRTEHLYLTIGMKMRIEHE